MELLFDRVTITDMGMQTSLSVPQFLALPLDERLRAVFERRVRFLRGERVIEMGEALQSLREWSQQGSTRR